MAEDGEGDVPDDRLQHEAEELMRQRRFPDAVGRYSDLRRTDPTDLWAFLGQVSALECAGDVEAAESLLEEAATRHRASAPLHRFRRSFFERREDLKRAATSTAELKRDLFDEGPPDQLADLYFNQGRYLEASAEFRRLLDADPEPEPKAACQSRLAACLRQLGEPEPARRLLEDALRHDPDQAWAQAELAECDRALGRADEAREGYRRALELQPDDHWVRGHLAQLESEQGNLRAAIDLYEDILQAQPKAVWARVELAQVLTNRDGDGDPDRARQLCLDALDLDSDYPWAHAQLGTLARRAGNLDDARRHLQRGVGVGQAPGWMLHELSDVCRHLGKHEEALTHLDRARAADPYDPAGYGYTADVLRHQGKGETAIPWLEKAVEIDEQYVWAWRELAELHALAGRNERAEAAYAAATKADPDSPINDGLRAFLLRLRGQREDAIAWLERAVERDPGYQWAWRELVDDLLYSERDDEALAACDRALAHHSNHAPLHAARAESLRRLGRRPEARLSVDAALSADPRMAQAWAISAELYAQESEFATALTAADQACAIDRAPEYRCLRVQVLVALGQFEAAASEIEQILARPDAPAIAWELAAVAAERGGHPERVPELLARAAKAGVSDARLRVRQARIGSAADVDALEKSVDAGDELPWREAAHVFAQAERGLSARRCAFRWIEDHSASDDAGAARAWVDLAEIEMVLDQPQQAVAAAEHALRRDPASVPARVVLAVLADQRGDRDATAQHLAAVAAVAGAIDEPGIIRQIASLHEKQERYGDAEMWWERLAAIDGQGSALRAAEKAAFLVRQGRLSADAGEAMAVELPFGSERRRLLRDAALAWTRVDQPLRGAALLLAHQPDAGQRLLAAQLFLDGRDPIQAEAQAAIAEPHPEFARMAALIRLRALLMRDPAAAIEATSAAATATPDDEDFAALNAEALALSGNPAAALAAVRNEALPLHPNAERLQWLAALTLECDGPLAAAQVLARNPRLPDTPLIRLFALAWGAETSVVSVSAVTVLPPLPSLAEHLANGWLRHERADLVEAFIPLILERVRPMPVEQQRRLLVLAATASLHRQHAAAARSFAWRARAPGLWLRSWWPKKGDETQDRPEPPE